jgi:hypothetical protein
LSSPVLQSFLKNLRDALQMSQTIEKVADGVLAKVRVKLSFEAL